MPELIIWKNQEINKLRKDMDQIFDRVWCEFCTTPSPKKMPRGVPSIELAETEDSLIIRAEIPGIAADDLDISISDDILTIRGEIRQETVEDRENYYRSERTYGSFSRAIQLPCRIEVEDIEATYKKGILSIAMPKCKAEKAKPVKITLK